MTTKTKKLGQQPPHSIYKIKEAAKAGLYHEAQQMCDETQLFFAAKTDECRDLFVKIEGLKRGHKVKL